MPTILVIDDSLYERQRHRFVLQTAGIGVEILETENGLEGLEMLKANADKIVLIILDWQMPQMDGPAFLREFINHPEWQRIKIIMSTSFGADERQQYVRQIFPHLAGYVVKPYLPETMVQAVKNVINP